MAFTYVHWLLFLSFIVIAIAIDLGILNKKPKALNHREASRMTMIWVLLASIFCSMIYFKAGRDSAVDFMTAYLIELSLSIDNVFVFILIFSYFKVPMPLQHRVLFWGILGAIVMRFIMIIVGIELFEKFSWLFFIFGAILIYSGYKISFSKEDHSTDFSKNKSLKLFKKFMPVSNDFDKSNFFTTLKGKLHATPLFVTLIFIEKTDLIFALDSIPAVLAVTQDTFIVFTSNIFAILGLRSLYFLLAAFVNKFMYLKYGIGLILSFVGIKMILGQLDMHIESVYSLCIIASILIGSVMISIKYSKAK